MPTPKTCPVCGEENVLLPLHLEHHDHEEVVGEVASVTIS
jgi:hypothetical protein